MNIGFDGKRAANNRTGLGNYSRWLISVLSRHVPSNNYFIYTPKKKNIPELEHMLQSGNVHLKMKPPGALASFWRSFGIGKNLAKDQINLFHGLSHEIPFYLSHTAVKSVVTVHDLIFLRYPEYFKWLDRTIYSFKCRYACKNADLIIAISEQTKRDIIKFYNIDPAKIEVVYQSCDELFKQRYSRDRLNDVRRKYGLSAKFILSVGTIEDRKNLRLAIQALPYIDPEYQLVVVGKMRAYADLVKQDIASLNLRDRVIFLNHVEFADLPVIYRLSRLFVYPSRFEGFGIPIIEALYSGIPVIAATGSCLEEAGGPGSVYVHPDDAVGLASHANRILGDPELYRQIQERGYDYVRNFDNDKLAGQIMNCYNKILDTKS